MNRINSGEENAQMKAPAGKLIVQRIKYEIRGSQSVLKTWCG
jgi:hypothetical protein